MFKRKLDDFIPQGHIQRKNVRRNRSDKKHSLDSDEEDYNDDDNVLDENDIEGKPNRLLIVSTRYNSHFRRGRKLGTSGG